MNTRDYFNYACVPLIKKSLGLSEEQVKENINEWLNICKLCEGDLDGTDKEVCYNCRLTQGTTG